MTDIPSLPEAERDRLAAEKVLGWTGDALARWSTFRERFHYGGRLEFDHLILCKVREWDGDDKLSFTKACITLHHARCREVRGAAWVAWLYYEPGDYRDAALLVLAEKGEI